MLPNPITLVMFRTNYNIDIFRRKCKGVSFIILQKLQPEIEIPKLEHLKTQNPNRTEEPETAIPGHAMCADNWLHT
jgi:hypothetical protein